MTHPNELWLGNTVLIRYDQKYAKQANRNGCFLEAEMDGDQLVRTVVVGRHWENGRAVQINAVQPYASCLWPSKSG